MKQFLFLIHFSFFFTVIFHNVLSGQNNIWESMQTAPITDPDYLSRNDVFLTHQYDSINHIIHVYAVNSTDSTTFLDTFKGHKSAFKTIIKDTRYGWKEMGGFETHYPLPDYQYYISHYDPKRIKMSIPPKSYIWESFPLKRKTCDFKTELKLSITVNKKIIKIDPIEITMDRSMALSEKEIILRNIDEYLLMKDLEPSKRNELLLAKVKFLFSLKERYEEAFELVNKVLKDDPNSTQGLCLKAKLLLSFSMYKKFSKVEKYLFSNAAMTVFAKIKPEYITNANAEYYRSLQKHLRAFNDNLITRSEWEVMNDLECETEGAQYYCFEERIIKDKVLVRFLEDQQVSDTFLTPVVVPMNESIFTVVAQLPYTPDIPGCMEELDTASRADCFLEVLIEDVYKSLEYPDLAIKHKVEGTVVIQLYIAQKNKIYCAKIIRDIGAGTGKAALKAMNLSLQKLLKEYKPCKWTPTKNRGQPSRVSWNIPIKFKLSNKD